jgi:auxin efflux carrier family protein
VLICAGGYLLAAHGILDKSSQRSLSQANLYFFTPALIFVKLGGQLRWDVVVYLWALPVLVAILISLAPLSGGRLIEGVGFAIARAMSRVMRLDQKWEKFVVACTIFQNVCRDSEF